jgi:hypothetical protein
MYIHLLDNLQKHAHLCTYIYLIIFRNMHIYFYLIICRNLRELGKFCLRPRDQISARSITARRLNIDPRARFHFEESFFSSSSGENRQEEKKLFCFSSCQNKLMTFYCGRMFSALIIWWTQLHCTAAPQTKIKTTINPPHPRPSEQWRMSPIHICPFPRSGAEHMCSFFIHRQRLFSPCRRRRLWPWERSRASVHSKTTPSKLNKGEKGGGGQGCMVARYFFRRYT